jgi:acyl-[acyl-carrier-protein] desaturase
VTLDNVTTTALLRGLEPVVEANLNRHLATAREWFPHEYVPWSKGRDFDGVLGGQAWEPGQSALSEVARTSLIVNLLTEDNLPSYHHEIAAMFGRDGAWGTWVHRWTAEEGRHGTAIRDYLLTTRAVDPVALERARMTHMSTGFTSPYDGSVLHSIAYVAFQELATRVAHRNTGRSSGDPVCEQLLARIALDENLHMIFYRALLGAAFDLVPDAAMRAVCDVVRTFQMPGHGIENFGRRSVQIAIAGIYDLRIHHDEVVGPVLRTLNVLNRGDLSGDGARARDELAAFLADLDRSASRFTQRREAVRSRAGRDANAVRVG